MMNLDYAEHTDIGRRNANQDFYCHVITADWALFAVADGLGGHDAGDKASRLFCQALTGLVAGSALDFVQNPQGVIERLMIDAAQQMSDEITEDLPDADACTTCAMVWLSEKLLVTAHVGDSRVYRMDSESIHWRTRDHSLVQVLLDQGLISEEEMGTHPYQWNLLNSICTNRTPRPELKLHPPLQPGESLLLCTDGFWEMIPGDEMIALGRSANLSDALSKAVGEAVRRAGLRSDNVTVQLIRTK